MNRFRANAIVLMMERFMAYDEYEEQPELEAAKDRMEHMSPSERDEKGARRLAAIARQQLDRACRDMNVDSWAELDSLGRMEAIMYIEEVADINIPLDALDPHEPVKAIVRALYPKVPISVIMEDTTVGALHRG